MLPANGCSYLHTKQPPVYPGVLQIASCGSKG
uniref:Uncharacterized protein n=1 Tax=Anguilla anguilla TaxID=7936 RepID=A0A0E9SL78_ANGAN